MNIKTLKGQTALGLLMVVLALVVVANSSYDIYKYYATTQTKAGLKAAETEVKGASSETDTIVSTDIEASQTVTPSPIATVTTKPTEQAKPSITATVVPTEKAVKPTATTIALKNPNPTTQRERMENEICIRWGMERCGAGISAVSSRNWVFNPMFKRATDFVGLFPMNCRNLDVLKAYGFVPKEDLQEVRDQMFECMDIALDYDKNIRAAKVIYDKGGYSFLMSKM